jgi:hypothetical protein
VTLPLAVPAGVVTAAVKVTAWPSTARLAEEVTEPVNLNEAPSSGIY